MTLHRFRLAPVAALVALLYLFVAPAALADTYVNGLVAKFAPGHVQVVADPAANPALSNANTINTQVLHTGKPIYIAAVAANQTGNATLDAVHSALTARIGNFSGVLLVIDAKGYHEGAYNNSISVKPLMDAAAADHRNDPNGAVSEFVSKLSTQSFGGPSSASPSAPRKADHTVLWAVLGVIGAIIALIVVVFLIVRGNEARARRHEHAVEVDDQIISSGPDVDALSTAVLAGADVSQHEVAASQALSAAKKARDAGDLDTASAHLKVVRTQVARADRKINPPSTPRTEHNEDAIAAVPQGQRKVAKVTATSPTGQTVVINNNDYRTNSGGSYNHYYGGGMLNGMYFYPGYYSNPFWYGGWGWSPTDILLTDALINDRWGGNYSQGYVDTATVADTSYSGDSSTNTEADTSFTGGDDSSSSGDTSYDGGSSSSDDTSYDPSPSYSGGGSSYDSGSSSSYDSGSSSSYDSGGGSSYDSGSSFDSGGGGSDFSSGSSDF